MRPGATPLDRFNAWFTRAIDKLKELPEGDGAFAAILISLPLYERYIVAKLKLDGRQPTKKNIRDEISSDLNLDEGQFRVFWEMFRNGFMHQGMTKAGKTKWLVSRHAGELPEFKTLQGQSCVCIDPWKFTARVIKAFQNDHRLITASESFPLADVFSLPADALLAERKALTNQEAATQQPESRFELGEVPHLILLGGLPGSGKTPHLDQLVQAGWERFDDFQANAYDNSPRFSKARRYAELVQALRCGKKCAVSDIRFVCADYRAEAQRSLQEDVGELGIEWRVFANDPLQCEQNIRGAVGQRQVAPRLAALKEFSRKYSLPLGVDPMAVLREAS
ncbi:MAG TPA: hypothetical protein VGX03_34010 [Candidatus Binatia bacterium]|jgi:hypothetical protein|nr:hypothetical protein [Candidatus Binatia bacterium]